MRVTSGQAHQLVQRPDLPASKHPPEQKEQALQELLEAYDGSVSRTLVDYSFLVRSGLKGELNHRAHELAEFSRALDSRSQGRKALIDFQRAGGQDPDLLTRSLGLSGDLEKGFHWWKTAGGAQVSETQRQTALELTARFDALSRVDSEALLTSLLDSPPNEATVDNLKKLLDQIESPALSPSAKWRVQDSDWRIRVDSGWNHELKLDPVEVEGVLNPRLRFQADHHQGDGKLEILVKKSAAYGYQPSLDFQLADGRQEVQLPSERAQIEIDVKPRSSNDVVEVSLGDFELVGDRPVVFARPEWTARGKWGPSLSDRFAVSWADSPVGPHGSGRTDALVSSTVDLAGCESPHLAFEARCEMKSWGDACRLEVAGENGEWKELKAYNGEFNWNPQQFSLEGFEGQKVRFRFRMETGDTEDEDGIEIADFRVLGKGEGEHVQPISGSTADKGQTRRLVKAYLELEPEQREPAVALWARLAEEHQQVTLPLDFWEAHHSDQPLQPQLDAFLRLNLKHPKDAGKLLALLNQRNGDLTQRAELLTRFSSNEYEAAMEFLDQSETPLPYYLQLTETGRPDSIEEALAALELPLAEDSLLERREWFADLAGSLGSNEEATASWNVVARWVPGNESPKELLQTFQTLVGTVDQDTKLARRVWVTLQNWHMEGRLGDRSLSECCQSVVQGLILAPGQVERQLGEVLGGEADIDFEETEEGLIIGDVYVERG